MYVHFVFHEKNSSFCVEYINVYRYISMWNIWHRSSSDVCPVYFLKEFWKQCYKTWNAVIVWVVTYVLMKFGSPFFNSITEYGLLVVMLVMYAMCLHTVEHLSLSSLERLWQKQFQKEPEKTRKASLKMLPISWSRWHQQRLLTIPSREEGNATKQWKRKERNKVLVLVQ